MHHDSEIADQEQDQPICVAIVDGIIDVGCDALSGTSISVESAMIPDGFDRPDDHATEIASLIFGNSAGIDPARNPIRGLSLPIFFHSGTGSTAAMASQMDLARALTIAAERDVAIVNISAGQKAATAEAGRHLQDAIALCLNRRILVIAAAGNDGCACLHVPAALNGVLAVGAMDLDGKPFAQSNYGNAYGANGILAPGVDLQVTGPGNVIRVRSGTSYATAVVTQVAAQLLAHSRRSGFGMDPIDIMSVLLDSADPCLPADAEDCPRILAGRLNIAAADRLLRERGSSRSLNPVQPSCQIQPTLPEGTNMSEANQMAPTAPGTQQAAMAADSIQPSADMAQSACSCERKKDVDQSACSCEKSKEKAEVARSSAPVGRVQASPMPTAPVAQSSARESSTLSQLSCGCGGDSAPIIAYALGSLWFDFGTEARYDAIVQQMGSPVAANTPAELMGFLSENVEFAGGITFVLMQDQIPIYAIQPAGPFAIDVYRALIDSIGGALGDESGMQRVGIPGLVKGTTRLMNGMVLPMLYPDKRGMVEWKTEELVKQVASLAGDAIGADGRDKIFNFLVRVYDELRNLGAAPHERAINFAATNAFQAARAFSHAIHSNLELFSIKVSKSPICRPDSDCWDVQLQMFDPENERRAGRVYRFTIDVSETLPVTIGPMRQWAAPLSAL